MGKGLARAAGAIVCLRQLEAEVIPIRITVHKRRKIGDRFGELSEIVVGLAAPARRRQRVGPERQQASQAGVVILLQIPLRERFENAVGFGMTVFHHLEQIIFQASHIAFVHLQQDKIEGASAGFAAKPLVGFQMGPRLLGQSEAACDSGGKQMGVGGNGPSPLRLLQVPPGRAKLMGVCLLPGPRHMIDGPTPRRRDACKCEKRRCQKSGAAKPARSNKSKWAGEHKQPRRKHNFQHYNRGVSLASFLALRKPLRYDAVGTSGGLAKGRLVPLHIVRGRIWLAVGLTLLLGLGIVFFGLPARHDLPATADRAWFADVTDAAGVDFVHDAGDLSKYQLPQIHGSGVALFDFDGDGLLDIYLLSHGGPNSSSINRLYKNLGGGRFEDVTDRSGLGIAGHNTGVIVGDVNNDGWPDVVVLQYGGIKLFLNRGDGTFADVTEQSGLKNPLWASSANFVDYDRDGWLDLVIANYLENDVSTHCFGLNSRREYCGPLVFPPTVCKLFRNLGGSGGPVCFEDVTVKSGLAKAPGSGLGVYCADFDGDGWPDIFIANDARPNHLWINQRDGTFREEAMARGIAVDCMGEPAGNMGVAVGDIDGDGLFDIYVTHLSSQRNTLWQQGPRRGMFQDRTGAAGLLHSAWRGTGFGTLLADFDDDGWPDLALVNGRVHRGTTTPNPFLGDYLKDYAERNQLFRNMGQGKFVDVSESNPAFCGAANVARGLAAGDLDGDGGLDLVLTTVAGRARVFRNVAPNRGHWLLVRAFDPRLRRDAYGAEVRVRVAGRSLFRIVNPGDSYQSSSDPRVHFGLGPAKRYEAVHVRWPDGLVEVFPGGAADQVITLRRGEGKEETVSDEAAKSGSKGAPR